MYYYHGTDQLFEQFDTQFIGVTHLTPHKELAAYHAKKRTGCGYIYTVNYKLTDPNMIYSPSMTSLRFHNVVHLEIIAVEVCV